MAFICEVVDGPLVPKVFGWGGARIGAGRKKGSKTVNKRPTDTLARQQIDEANNLAKLEAQARLEAKVRKELAKRICICVVCQTGFDIPLGGRKRKCCSAECIAIQERLRPSRLKPRTLKPFVCQWCGQEGRSDQNRPKYHPGDCTRMAVRQIALTRALPQREAKKRECAGCGARFTPYKRSSQQIASGFVQRYCSRSCGVRLLKNEQAEAPAVRLVKPETVAKQEAVDPFVVFERDGWRCHLCGKLTDKSKRGTRHPRAPELDHIVPRSKGGAHTYQNTACACSECNNKKNDKVLGQLRLF